MDKVRIMIEPGKNWTGKSVKTKVGNVYEYDFYTDIVYKIMEIFNGTDVEIIDPSWARKYVNANERVEFLHNSENLFDLFISLRFIEPGSQNFMNIISKKDHKKSLAYVEDFTNGVKHFINDFDMETTEISVIDNKYYSILNGINKPGFIVECIPCTEPLLALQNNRINIANTIACGISAIIGTFTFSPFTPIKSDMVGETICSDVIVRTAPMLSAPIRMILPKEYRIEIYNEMPVDGWYEVLYGGSTCFVDMNHVRITKKYNSVIDIDPTTLVIETMGWYGIITDTIARVKDYNTLKTIGVLFKNARVQIYGQLGDKYAIVGGAIPYGIVKLKHVSVIENDEDASKDNKNGVTITANELNRLGYTHIII